MSKHTKQPVNRSVSLGVHLIVIFFVYLFAAIVGGVIVLMFVGIFLPEAQFTLSDQGFTAFEAAIMYITIAAIAIVLGMVRSAKSGFDKLGEDEFKAPKFEVVEQNNEKHGADSTSSVESKDKLTEIEKQLWGK